MQKFNKTTLVYLLLILFGTFILFSPPKDPDFGWHYRYGEYAFKNHQLLRQNIFSYTMPDYQWANSYWVPQIIMYTLYEYTAPIGMSLIIGFLLSAAIVLVLSKTPLSPTSKTPLPLIGKIFAALLFFIFVRGYLVSVRPLGFNTIFFPLLLYALLYKPKYQKFLPFLFLIWANFHADFVLGIFILGIHTAFTLAKDIYPKFQGFKPLFKKSAIPIICVLATLINPYHVQLWLTILKETGHIFGLSYIQEFQTLSTKNPLEWGLKLLILAIFGSSAILRAKKFGCWYPAIVYFFFLLSLKATYFGRIAACIGIFGVAATWGFIFENLLKKVKTTTQRFLYPMLGVLAGLLLIVSIEVFVENVSLVYPMESWATESYPYHAVEFIKNQSDPPTGNMYNTYGWGGYLIWQLPEYKTFIDGRMASWKTAEINLFADYIAITTKPEENWELFEKYTNEYNITWTITKNEAVLAKYMLENHSDSWKEIYSDDVSVVLTRDILSE